MRVRAFLLIFPLLGLAGMIADSAPADSWNDQSLADFLQAHNQSEIIFVQDAEILQNGQPVPLYDQVGNEELRTQLGERPILRLAKPQGPFVRGQRWVARIDRSLGFDVLLRLQKVRRNTHGASREEIQDAWIAYPPQLKITKITESHGRFHVVIPQPPACTKFQMIVRTSDRSHLLEIHFLNRQKPVTLQNQ
jgi:predicted dienelactone hydrolase